MNVLAFPRPRVTRDEHRARMLQAERMLFEEGWSTTRVERRLAEEHQITARQARRYVHAVRTIYKQRAAASPAASMDELLILLRARAAQSIVGDEPDWKASVKALELEARIRGLLDRRSTVTVQGTIGLQPLPALDGASDEEIAALAAFHDARARRLAAQAEVVGQLPALTRDGG